jgi:Ion transport protein
VYTADVIVKIVALGTARYFRSGWNCFDFAVTLATYVGLVLELIAADDSNLVFLFTVRNIR